MKSVEKIFIPLHKLSPNRVVREVASVFESGAEVVEVRSHLPLRFYCFRNPEHLVRLYSHPSCGKTKPPHFLKWANHLMGDGLFNDLGTEKWDEKRKLMIKSFSQGQSSRYFRFMDEALDFALARWKAREQIDLFHETQLLVTDFSHRLLFGVGAGSALEELNEASHWAESQFSNLLPLSIPTPSSLRFKGCKRYLRDYFLEKIAEQITGSQSSPDRDSMISQLAHSGLSPDQFLDELFSVHFGVSALSVALGWHLYLMGLHSDVQKSVSEVSNDEVLLSALVGRVSDECMRFLPPFFCSLRYSVADIDLGDFKFGKGSTFMLLRFFAQRHPNYWNQPDVFDPSRFIGKPKSRLMPGVLMPFGFGPRTCLGAHLAGPVLKSAFARVVREFEVRIRATENWKELVDFRYGLFPNQSIKLDLRRRPAHAIPLSAHSKSHDSSQVIENPQSGAKASGSIESARCPFSGL